MQFTVTDIMPAIPELVLLGSALLFLLIGAWKGQASTKAITWYSYGAILFCAYRLMRLPAEKTLGLHGLFVSDPFIIFCKFLLLFGALAVLFLAFGVIKQQPPQERHFEMPVLILLSLVGMMGMISSNDFIGLYLGLELQSLCLYVLAAFDRNNAKSSEAGLKYFVMGALASGLLLYGISLIYGFTGTTRFDDLHHLYASGATLPLGVLVGMILVIIAFCFKISAVPFHMWTPDVYEGSPTIVTSFFAIAPKVAAVSLFVRFLFVPFGFSLKDWQQVIIVVSILSMVIGALGALRQSNIKRLMAYSSIGHMGYILLGVAAGSVKGIQAVLIYLAIYITMSAGTFAIILMMKYKDGRECDQISDFAGLSRTRPLLAIALSVMMFSMAGIPPLAGFFGKFYIFLAAIEAKLYITAIIGIISSVVATFYYLKVVKVMYLDQPVEMLDKHQEKSMVLVTGISSVFNILFFITPAPLVEAASVAAGVLFP